MVDQNQEPIVAQSSESQEKQQLQHSPDPTTYLPSYHAPCTCTPLGCCFGSNNTMKRRSPSCTATLQDPSSGAATEHRASKKLFREPEHANAVGASCLSPQPSIKGFASDPTTPSSTAGTFSRSSSWGDKGVDLTNEEASNSMKLRRMKDCLRGMRKWWDEVMQEEEEEEDDPEGAEDDKVLSKDDCGGDAEEAVRVEWAEKCISICFKCPCSKGYQILLSGNNCYYKLV